MPDHPETPRRQGGGELVIPVMAIALTLYFFSTIIHSPWTAQVNAFLVGSILIALSLLFIAKTLWRVRAGKSSFGFGNLVRRDDLSSGRAGLFVLTVGYVYCIDWGGFTLTTFVFLVASMALLTKGKRLGTITLVSALMALGGWVLFIWLFDTRFPRGPFEEMMRGLIHG